MKSSALAAVAVALLSAMDPLPAMAGSYHGHYNWNGHHNRHYVNRWNGYRNYNHYNHYNNFYGGFGYGLGAGILGFGLGLGLANGYTNYYRNYNDGYGYGYDSYGYDHVARCEARFRSYDASTDTYLGYDGYHHRCPL
jgi:hypothetical protein